MYQCEIMWLSGVGSDCSGKIMWISLLGTGLICNDTLLCLAITQHPVRCHINTFTSLLLSPWLLPQLHFTFSSIPCTCMVTSCRYLCCPVVVIKFVLHILPCSQSIHVLVLKYTYTEEFLETVLYGIITFCRGISCSQEGNHSQQDQSYWQDGTSIPGSTVCMFNCRLYCCYNGFL